LDYIIGTTIRLTWPHRLWDFKRPYQWNGVSGALEHVVAAASCLWRRS
jgi:hypothetical protein